jgi:DNA polymerase
MYSIVIDPPDDFAAFRAAARRLLAARIDPADVAWTDRPDAALFADPLPETERVAAVPRAFVELAEAVACHSDDARWALLYRLLWRIAEGERTLMDQPSDTLVHRLQRMAASVRRDAHRMTAFVRFRILEDDDGPCSVAWYQPQHRILRRATPFFIDRFASLRFSILTPDLSAHWDRLTVRFAAGLSRSAAPAGDEVEDWWKRYYCATFNPARANPELLLSHMPKRFRRDLPEADSIENLLRSAGTRTDGMIGGQTQPSAARSPPTPCCAQTPHTTPPASDGPASRDAKRSGNPDTPAHRPP